MDEDVQRRIDRLAMLTERQRQVVRLRAEGRSLSQIGAALEIQEPTVKEHLNHVYKALGISHLTASKVALTLELQQYRQALEQMAAAAPSGQAKPGRRQNGRPRVAVPTPHLKNGSARSLAQPSGAPESPVAFWLRARAGRAVMLSLLAVVAGAAVLLLAGLAMQPRVVVTAPALGVGGTSSPSELAGPTPGSSGARDGSTPPQPAPAIAPPAPATPAAPATFSFVLPATEPWPRSVPAIEIPTGMLVRISAAAGDARYCPDCPVSPDGASRLLPARSVATTENYLVRGLWKNALICKVGEAGTPFNAGTHYAFVAGVPGRFYCTINDALANDYWGWADNAGGWPVTVALQPVWVTKAPMPTARPQRVTGSCMRSVEPRGERTSPPSKSMTRRRTGGRPGPRCQRRGGSSRWWGRATASCTPSGGPTATGARRSWRNTIRSRTSG